MADTLRQRYRQAVRRLMRGHEVKVAVPADAADVTRTVVLEFSDGSTHRIEVPPGWSLRDLKVEVGRELRPLPRLLLLLGAAAALVALLVWIGSPWFFNLAAGGGAGYLAHSLTRWIERE